MTGRASVVSVVAMICLAACSESSPLTSPTLASRADVIAAASFVSDPPPPPLDTASLVSTDEGSFTLGTTYFLNRTETNGFVSFTQQQADGVSIEPEARISYHQGAFSGQGTITLLASGGVITIDLASDINARTSFFASDCTKTCASIGFTGSYTPRGGVAGPIAGTITVGASNVTVE